MGARRVLAGGMMSAMSDPFGARTPLAGHGLDYYRLARLDEAGVADTSRLPYTVRVLLEMALRNAGSIHVTEDDGGSMLRSMAPLITRHRSRSFPSRFMFVG